MSLADELAQGVLGSARGPLIRRGWVGADDAEELVEMAEAWSIIRRVRARIADGGDIVVPIFHAAASGFGMTPDARARMVGTDDVDPTDDLLSGLGRRRRLDPDMR